MSKPVEILNEDPLIEGQKWVCISFISPEEAKVKTKINALKIRGVYDTYEEAEKRCQFLREIDPSFNIFVGEVGKWLPWNPDPYDEKYVKDRKYAEEQLQKLMDGYKDNQEKAKMYQEFRKQQAKMEATQQNIKNTSDVRDKLKKKLEKKEGEKQKSLQESIKNYDNMIEKLKKQQESLNKDKIELSKDVLEKINEDEKIKMKDEIEKLEKSL